MRNMSTIKLDCHLRLWALYLERLLKRIKIRSIKRAHWRRFVIWPMRLEIWLLVSKMQALAKNESPRTKGTTLLLTTWRVTLILSRHVSIHCLTLFMKEVQVHSHIHEFLKLIPQATSNPITQLLGHLFPIIKNCNPSMPIKMLNKGRLLMIFVELAAFLATKKQISNVKVSINRVVLCVVDRIYLTVVSHVYQTG